MPRRVLIINSWHQDLPWQKAFEAGLKAGLKDVKPRFETYSEYLDTGRFAEVDHLPITARYLAEKYRSMAIDIVVTESIAAAKFLAARPELFPGARRIHVNAGDATELGSWPNASAALFIPVVSDYVGAITEMVRMATPKSIYVVADANAPSGRHRLESFKTALAARGTQADTAFLVDLPMDQLLEKVSHLPERSAIFYLPVFRDGAGKQFAPYRAAAMIAERANAPVFSHWQSILKGRILGGYVLSAERVGRVVARSLVDWGRESAPAIPPTASCGGACAYVYDWREMKRWNLSKNRLLPGTDLLHYEPTVFEAYTWETVGAGVVLLILAGLSIFLFDARQSAKRLNGELRDMTDTALAANQAKSMFLANMSHELRTPLNAIIGFADMIRLEVLGAISPPAYRGYADDIHASGNHLLSLFDEILTLSKIESGRQVLHIATVELNEIISESLTFVKGRAESGEVEIRLDLPADLPRVAADRMGTKQVLVNLVMNAVKFTPKGGRIIITGAIENGMVVVTIADTGVGMNAGEIQRAFEPFVQIEREKGRSHEGAGLGLPLSKWLIEKQNGWFGLESEPGHGTTASFSLPVAAD